MEELTVTIEKLASDGRGIARKDGIVIFVEKTCPEDICRIEIVKKNKSYYIGKLKEIIKKSPHRIKSFCPMQNVCGSCNLQYIDYDYQLQIKKQIVEDAMKKIDIEIKYPILSPHQQGYRHKIQYPIRQTQVSKKILAGYFKPKSHDIVNIKYCPIQPEICDKIIEFIREQAPIYKIEGYNEEKNTGLLRHVIMRVSSENGSVLVALVINHDKPPERVKDFAQTLFDKFDVISGVTVNYNTFKSNLILTDKTDVIVGCGYITDKICNIEFKIGTNTFFQVNPKSAENIFKYIRNYIGDNYKKPNLLDAYAGISAFGLVMADLCNEVVSIEECEASVNLAKEVMKNNNIKNIELKNEDCSEFFKSISESKKKFFDITILDPPRKGCSEESLKYALNLTKSEIIYVSCNPATLARDLEYLVSRNAKVKSIQPFDMFCHTTHIENVAIIDVTNTN